MATGRGNTSDTRRIIRAATKHRAMLATTRDALKPGAALVDVIAHRIAVSAFVAEMDKLSPLEARYMLHYASQDEARRAAMWAGLHDRLANTAREARKDGGLWIEAALSGPH